MAVLRKENTMPLKTDEMTTILGRGSEFEGKLHFEGTLQIEGVYSGEINSDSTLIVGDGAKVSAEINVGTVVINGEVRGNIRAAQGVEIRGGGKMFGNIETPTLQIEKGVIFEGNCKMQNLSLKGGPAFPEKTQKAPEPPKK